MSKKFFSFLTARLFAKHKTAFLLSILCSIVRSMLLLVPSLLTRYIIDLGFYNYDMGKILQLSLLSIIIPVTTCSLIITDLILNKYILREFSILRTELYESLLYRRLSEFTSLKSGDLTFRFVNETDMLANFFYFGIGNLVWINTTIITGVLLVAFQGGRIAFGVVVLMLLRMFASYWSGKTLKACGKKNNEISSELNSITKETFTNIELIKGCAKETQCLSALEQALDRRFETAVELQNAKDRIDIIKTLIDLATNALFYLYGGLLAIRGNLSVGMLCASVAIYSWILPAVEGYINLHIDFSRNISAIERVFRFWDNNRKTHTNKSPTRYDIELKNVSFYYTDNKPVLRDFNLKIPEKERLLVMGESGSGKSTIVNLISGLQSSTSGSVLIGGIPIDDISERWIRDNIVVISQDGILYNDSIKANILFGMEEYDRSKLDEILRMTTLDKMIEKLPDGIETNVGEHGSKLSGGERQRVLLARALLRPAKVFILDESTSALDVQTERNILKTILSRYSDCTFFVVSHRSGVAGIFDKELHLKKVV